MGSTHSRHRVHHSLNKGVGGIGTATYGVSSATMKPPGTTTLICCSQMVV